jgi:raffinose/stachyose/melibiose transport system permease protein
VLALTGGGPSGATETLATQVYKETFTYNAFGSGAAMALLLCALILIFSIAQQYATRDRAQIGG